MNYALDIKEHNKQAHIDIEDEIQTKKNGLFTCIIRVNNGNIVDSVVMEYADARKYLVLKQITIQELTVSRVDRVGGQTDPIR